MNKKIAVVTGGSSGIGKATANMLVSKGFEVFELSRRDITQPCIHHIYADITKSETVEAAIGEIVKATGRIDLLINNAGSGISGAVEFTDDQAALLQVSTLFCGMDKVTRTCLPYLRQSKGRIINVSSVAAVLPIPFQAYYSAMKSAVNFYTMALANEVKRFGIGVCAVMPGDTTTGFTSARKCITDGDDIYGGAISRSVGRMENDERNGASPEKVASVIVKAATKKHIKPLYSVGFEYKVFCVLSKILPYGLMNKLVGMLYAK